MGSREFVEKEQFNELSGGVWPVDVDLEID
jgi:hypothetical protein